MANIKEPFQNNQWGEMIELITTGDDLTVQKTVHGRTPVVTPIGTLSQESAEHLRDFLNANYPA